MNTITIANPAQTASPAHSGGAPAAAPGPGDAGDGGLDFAGLLGAGIGRSTDPAQASEPVQIAKDAIPKDLTKDFSKDLGGDVPACDPAALLDAIAAGKASADPQQLTASQAALQPMPALLAPVDPATVARAADSATLPVIARDSAPSARVRPDGGKSMPHADTRMTANLPRATDARHEADVEPAVPVAQSPAHEPVPVPVLKAEFPERRLEPASQLPAVGSAPNHALAPSPSANAASVVAHVEHLAQPFGSPAWDDGFASRVVWMVRNDVQSAEIRLNPPDLGPIEVKLVLSNDQGAQASATVQFSAAHAATREAIESALPRLREMLLENGIALGNTTVDARTTGNAPGSGDSGRPSQGGRQSEDHAGQAPDTANQPRPGNPLRRGNGLVDTFA